jgi:PKD repeat protein
MVRLRRTLALLLVASLACGLALGNAAASPALPYVLNGVISMNGRPVPDQLLLEAKISQVTYAATYTKGGGFGLDPVFKVPADQLDTERLEGGRDGDKVELYLDGVKIAETIFASGLVRRLVLEVGDLVNAPPTAFFKQVDCVVGYTALFDGSESRDPEGEPISYSWDFGDGCSSDESTPVHIYVESGEYEASLRVSDPYGSSGLYTQTVHVSELPEPEYWQLITLDEQVETYYSEETWMKLTAQSLEPAYVTVVRYDEAFIDDGRLILSSQQLWSLTATNQQLVSYPIYVEVPLTKVGDVPPNTMVYTWRNGGWEKCPNSGTSHDRVWAYLSQDELGLLALGLSENYVKTTVKEIEPSSEAGGHTVILELNSIGYTGEYRLNLRVDDRLLSVESASLNRGEIMSLEMSFSATPGPHKVSVNGCEREYKVASLLSNIFIVGLGVAPVSLISLLIKRQLR